MNYRPFFSPLVTLFKNIRDKYLYLRRRPYLKYLNKLFSTDTTIISSNCFAGRILQDLKREYNTPTLGLYFWAPDFIEFISKLGYYLNTPITFVEKSKYPEGNKRRAEWPHWYPIGLLDGKVEIHFLHYHSEEEAANKWYRRAKRVNLNKVFIIGMDQNLGTEKEVKAFDQLPYQDKVYFSRFSLSYLSNEYIPEFRNKVSVGDPYKKGHVFYKHLFNHFKRLPE